MRKILRLVIFILILGLIGLMALQSHRAPAQTVPRYKTGQYLDSVAATSVGYAKVLHVIKSGDGGVPYSLDLVSLPDGRECVVTYKSTGVATTCTPPNR